MLWIGFYNIASYFLENSFDYSNVLLFIVHVIVIKPLCHFFFVSGLIVPEVRGNETVPEVVTTSGYALLHFFSDAAYNLTGFNIFYS